MLKMLNVYFDITDIKHFCFSYTKLEKKTIESTELTQTISTCIKVSNMILFHLLMAKLDFKRVLYKHITALIRCGLPWYGYLSILTASWDVISTSQVVKKRKERGQNGHPYI